MLRLLLWLLSLAWPVIEVVGVMRWLGRLYSSGQAGRQVGDGRRGVRRGCVGDEGVRTPTRNFMAGSFQPPSQKGGSGWPAGWLTP